MMKCIIRKGRGMWQRRTRDIDTGAFWMSRRQSWDDHSKRKAGGKLLPAHACAFYSTEFVHSAKRWEFNILHQNDIHRSHENPPVSYLFPVKSSCPNSLPAVSRYYLCVSLSSKRFSGSPNFKSMAVLISSIVQFTFQYRNKSSEDQEADRGRNFFANGLPMILLIFSVGSLSSSRQHCRP
jgi:hypothetical protein